MHFPDIRFTLQVYHHILEFKLHIPSIFPLLTERILVFVFWLFCVVLFFACRYLTQFFECIALPAFLESPNFDPTESHRVIYQFYGRSDQTDRLGLSLECNLVKSGISAFSLPSLPFPCLFPIKKSLSVPYPKPNISSHI